MCFFSISSMLPPNVQTYLQKNDSNLAPKLTTHEVQCRIMKAKKPNGLVPGDLPKKIVQKCARTLAIPVTMIHCKKCHGLRTL